MSVKMDPVMVVQFKRKINGERGYECHQIEEKDGKFRLIYDSGVEMTIKPEDILSIKAEVRMSESL